MESFRRHPLPMYMKLLFDEASNWRSFDRVEDCRVSEGLIGIIDRMIARLSNEANHGPILVSRALGYLSAARRGLGETEILDVLSRDDAIWADFQSRSHHEPLQRRLPYIIWSRLLFDLEPYLTEVIGPEGNLLVFYHGQIRNRIAEKFLSSEARVTAHRSLAAYFRCTADPEQRGQWDGDSARALRELPFHAAGANNSDEVIALLTSLPYLSSRVATGNAYQLPDDYALTTGSEEFTKWQSFIQRHAQRLTRHPKMLVALVELEGFPSAQQQIHLRKWPYPRLKSWMEPTPTGRTVSSGLRIEIKAENRFAHRRVGAVAWQAGILFIVERVGLVGTLEYRHMQQLLTRLQIGHGRPIQIACAADASSLMVILEPGVAELYRCTLAANGRPVASELASRFQCCLPEIDDPVVEWNGGRFWMQIRPGMLARVDPATATVEEEPLCGGAPGELGALLFFDDGTKFAALRQGHSTILGPAHGGPARNVASSLCAACRCGDYAAVFFFDGQATLFGVTQEVIPITTITTGMLRGAAGWDGKQLLWLEESADFPKLHAWRPGEKKEPTAGGRTAAIPRGVDVIPRAWR